MNFHDRETAIVLFWSEFHILLYFGPHIVCQIRKEWAVLNIWFLQYAGNHFRQCVVIETR
jgi:hypothetical protein